MRLAWASSPEVPARALLQEADTALYAAKAAGKGTARRKKAQLPQKVS